MWKDNESVWLYVYQREKLSESMCLNERVCGREKERQAVRAWERVCVYVFVIALLAFFHVLNVQSIGVVVSCSSRLSYIFFRRKPPNWTFRLAHFLSPFGEKKLKKNKSFCRRQKTLSKNKQVCWCSRHVWIWRVVTGVAHKLVKCPFKVFVFWKEVILFSNCNSLFLVAKICDPGPATWMSSRLNKKVFRNFQPFDDS
jgi:hypothetical protein